MNSRRVKALAATQIASWKSTGAKIGNLWKGKNLIFLFQKNKGDTSGIPLKRGETEGGGTWRRKEGEGECVFTVGGIDAPGELGVPG